MDETHVVTCFLRNRGEVLLLRRSAEVGSYPGAWGGVAGHAEGDPDRAAREEIAEETGLLDACTLARAGVPFTLEDENIDTEWTVHPYCFDCERRDVETDWETAEFEWVHPTEILRRETVPNLWASYSRVGPTAQRIAEDSDHGSAYLSVRALEVLRDRAGSFAANDPDADRWPQLVAIAERLLDARPSMAAVANRVNRAMADAAASAIADEGDVSADENDLSAEAVERAAREGIERAYRVDERAAANAAAEIRGESVLTLSRSGTVLDALSAADEVFVAESRPAREGVGVAEELAATAGDSGPDTTLHTDAATAHVLATEDVDRVVVGADAILPDGRVVNKTGTRGAALAANREGVPVHAVAASDKVRTDDAVHPEEGDPAAVYDGEADVAVLNPTFDATPADAVSGVITERGVLDDAGISAVADELRGLTEWRESE
ncbi:NUDIX domain-containing protein [Halorussus gelatinilyticus]|uniref:NUDIX domain-containing protein n=1 Tax=Halorussus gelatinilyticus TaxID=2937524 RepID=A0A8U0IM21_9EURY|nr:NUDIX domain-containing protein [Halorussus gelatinilyticus]UPW02193.1 NUDIX domain-containing protein [Halorussus gelatinilyticus]